MNTDWKKKYDYRKGPAVLRDLRIKKSVYKLNRKMIVAKEK